MPRRAIASLNPSDVLQASQKPDSHVTESKQTPLPEEKKSTPYRLKPSRNQRQRSKLQQVPEESATPAPVAPAPAPTPAPPSPETPLLQRNRLKRSGHLREDLLKPPPEDKPPEPEAEY